MIRKLCVVVTVWASLALSAHAVAGEVLYTFRGQSDGGLARVVVDDETGKVVSHAPLLRDARLASAHKIAVDAQRNIAVVVNASARDAGAWFVDLHGEREPVFVALAAEPDGVCVVAGAAHIGLDNGRIVSIDLDTHKVIATFNPRNQLTPPGQKPEFFCAVPSRGIILVSFQKDHHSGERKGNRIVALRERTLELVADVQLPRTMPALHNPSTPKEQGPGPEVIAVCERTGSVLVTIDLYGAVLPLRLDDLLDGHTGDAPYHSTAYNGSLGTAFPDRVVTLREDRSHIAAVFNAGSAGGGVVVDFATGAILHRFSVPYGLEPVGPVRDARVFATHAGKVKSRTPSEVEKHYWPRAVLTELVIEESGVEITHHDAPLTTHLAAQATKDRTRLLVVLGEDRDRISLFTVDRGFDDEILRALGRIERVYGAR